MKAIIWTKENCPFCTKAKRELELRGIQYEVRQLGQGWTREQLLAAVPDAKTVPQIFIDNVLVGGYNNLMDSA